MSMSDPIADFLTRIRNAFRTDKRWVDIPSSNMKKRMLKPEILVKQIFHSKIELNRRANDMRFATIWFLKFVINYVKRPS